MLNNGTGLGTQRRGTVIVLVIVMLALLAIMGTTFVITSRIERVAMDNSRAGFASGQATQSAMKIIEDRIKTTLELDIWGVPHDVPTAPLTVLQVNLQDRNRYNLQRLLGAPANADGNSANPATMVNYNESWDAPSGGMTASMATCSAGVWTVVNNATVDGDPWLAPLAAPENDGDRWSQTSNWYSRVYYDAAANQAVVVRSIGRFVGTNWQAPIDFVNNVRHELAATAPADRQEQFADADGDGYFDSVWVYSRGVFRESSAKDGVFVRVDADLDDNPATTGDDNIRFNGLAWPEGEGLPSINGKCVAVAVRIIDLCGMVNANTAWQWPGGASPDTLWRGAELTGINLFAEDPDNPGDYFFGYSNTSRMDEAGRDNNPSDNQLTDFQKYYVLKLGEPDRPDWTKSWDSISSADRSRLIPFDFSDEMKLRRNFGRALPTDQPTTFMDTMLPQTKPTSTTAVELARAQAVKNRLPPYNYTRNIAQQQPITRIYSNDSQRYLNLSDPRGYDLDQTIGDLIYRVKHNQFEGATAAERAVRKARVQAFVKAIRTMFEAAPESANYADGLGGTAGSNDALDAALYRTWQYIANLVDYFDGDGTGPADDEPTVLETADTDPDPEPDDDLESDLGLHDPNRDITQFLYNPNWVTNPTSTATKVYGLERHAIVTRVTITCTAVVLIPHEEPQVDEVRYSYSVEAEVGNPWPTSIRNPRSLAYIVATTGATPTPHIAGNAPLNGDDTLAGTTTGNDIDGLATATLGTFAVTVNEGTSPGDVKIVVATRRNVDGIWMVEDILSTQSLPLPNIDTTPTEEGQHHTQSFARETSVDDEDRWRALSNTAGSAGADATGYVTSTTNAVLLGEGTSSELYRSTNFSNTDDWAVDASGNYRAKVRSPLDLIAVPVVGSWLDTDNLLPKTIGDVLGNGNDATIHIDLRNGALGVAFRQHVLSQFAPSSIHRSAPNASNVTVASVNGVGTGATGGNDVIIRNDLDRMRLPGLININTALTRIDPDGDGANRIPSAAPVFAMHPLIGDRAESVAYSGGTPRQSPADAAAMLYSDTAASEDFGLADLPDADGSGNTTRDAIGNATKFFRAANLMTTRSDTFGAYILLKTLNADGTTDSQERWFMIFDRSLCNQPMWAWVPSGTAGSWQKNPGYRRPTVVFRQRID